MVHTPRGNPLAVERTDANALLMQLDAAFESEIKTRIDNDYMNMEFVHYDKSFHACNTCNGVMVSWLRQLGCDVSAWLCAGSSLEVQGPSAAVLKPAFSSASAFWIGRRTSAPTRGASSPSRSMINVLRVPRSVAASSCVAIIRTPSALAAHANRRSGSSAVTVQMRARWAGCLIRACDPIATGGSLTHSTLVMVGVNSGHDSIVEGELPHARDRRVDLQAVFDSHSFLNTNSGYGPLDVTLRCQNRVARMRPFPTMASDHAAPNPRRRRLCACSGGLFRPERGPIRLPIRARR